MRAGDDIRNEFRIGGIRNRRLEDPDHGSFSRPCETFEADGFPQNGRISVQAGRPEVIGQNGRAVRGRPVVAAVQ